MTEKEYEEYQFRKLKEKQMKIAKKKQRNAKNKKTAEEIALEIEKELLKEKKEKGKEKKSKYNNTITNIDGIRFDSKKEADYYTKLMLLKKAGEVVDIELQPKFLLQEGFNKNGVRHRPINYFADFRVKYKDGRDEIVDVKSSKTYKTQMYRMKKKMFEYKYPGLEIKEVYDVEQLF